MLLAASRPATALSPLLLSLVLLFVCAHQLNAANAAADPSPLQGRARALLPPQAEERGAQRSNLVPHPARRIRRGVVAEDADLQEVNDELENPPYDVIYDLKSDGEKRKWSTGRNMAVWGKRDGGGVYDDDDLMMNGEEKRKWSGGNMAVGGKKRRWSSGNMAVWGKRGAAGGVRGGKKGNANPEGALNWGDDENERASERNEKRKWSGGKNMALWG